MSAQAGPRGKMLGRLFPDKVSRAAAPVVRFVVREREITSAQAEGSVVRERAITT